MSKIKGVLISVSDKTGIVDFDKELAKYHVEILSTGGTSKALKEADLNVKDVSEHRTLANLRALRGHILSQKLAYDIT